MIKRKRCIYTINSVEGLFSTYNSLLALLDYCLTNGYVPFVKTTKDFLYKTSEDNERHLDYFFSISEIYEDEYEIDGEICINNGMLYRNRSYMRYPYSFPNDIKIREYNNKLSSYIHINKEVIDISDNFVSTHFNNKKVIGVHIRGTDRTTQLLRYTKKDINGIIDLYVSQILDRQPFDLIYVATDESFVIPLLKMHRIINKKIVYRDVKRSRNGIPVHFSKHNGV